MAADNDLSIRRRRFIEGNAASSLQAAGCQPFGDRLRECVEMGKHRAIGRGLERRVETAHGAMEEAAYFVRPAKQMLPALPLRNDILGAQRVLGKASSGAALTLLCVAPTLVDIGSALGEIDTEVEPKLFGAAVAEQ